MTFDLEFVMAVIIGTIAVARGTRLFVDDDMPLFSHFRTWWTLKMPTPWNELIICPFCTSVWLAGANTAWAFGSGLHWTWWFLNLMLAGAYVAAMINVRDIPVE